MRHFLALLAFVALSFAPLAAPAAAMAADRTLAECVEMPAHDKPPAHHQQGEPCCIAVPPAIDPPSHEVGAIEPAEHPAFVTLAVPFLLGAGPHIEDPPPRFA